MQTRPLSATRCDADCDLNGPILAPRNLTSVPGEGEIVTVVMRKRDLTALDLKMPE